MNNKKDVILLILANIIWGFTFVTVKNVLSHIGVYSFLFWRFLIGGISLHILVNLFYRNKIHSKTQYKGALYTGVILFLGYYFQTEGLKFTSSTKSGFLTGLYGATVPVFAFLILKIKPGLKSILGLVLAIIGTAFFSLSTELSMDLNKGDIMTLLCALCFGMQIVMVSKYIKNVNLYMFTIYQLYTVSFISFFMAVLSSEKIFYFNGPIIYALFICGILATAVCYIIQSISQNTLSPNKAAVIYTIEPLSAWFAGYIFLYEQISFLKIAGAFLIITGVLVTQIRLKR